MSSPGRVPTTITRYRAPVSDGRQDRSLSMQMTRRAFASGAVAASLVPPVSAAPLEPLSPGIKISMQVNESVSDEDLTWIKEMGVEYLNVQTGSGRATLENFVAIKRQV